MATDDHMKIEALGLPPGGEIMNFGRFDLENGFSIDEVVVGYTTYGTLNEVRRDRPAEVPADIFFTFYPPPPADADAPASLAPLPGWRQRHHRRTQFNVQ